MRKLTRLRLLAGLLVALLLAAPAQGAAALDEHPMARELEVQGRELEANAADARAQAFLLPEGFAPGLLDTVPADQLATQLREDLEELKPVLDAVGGVVNPVWLSRNGDAVLAYIKAHTDSATGRFTFDGPTAELDAAIARSALEGLAEVQQHREVLDTILPDLASLFATGELPDGYTVRLPTEDDVPSLLAAAGQAPEEAAQEVQVMYAETVPADVQRHAAAASEKAGHATRQAYASLPAPAQQAADGALDLVKEKASEAPLPVGGIAADALAALEAYLREHPEPAPPAQEPGEPTQWPEEAEAQQVLEESITIHDVWTDKDTYRPGEVVNVTISYTAVYNPDHLHDSTFCRARAYAAWRIGQFVQSFGFAYGPVSGEVTVQVPLTDTGHPDDEGVWILESVCMSDGPGGHVATNGGAFGHEGRFTVAFVDLAIKDENIKFQMVRGTPPDNPTAWEAQINATYTVHTRQCKNESYFVRLSIEGNAPREIPKTSACGTDQINETVLMAKGAVIEVFLDSQLQVKETVEDNNVAVKRFGVSEVLDVFPEWKGGYLAGTSTVGLSGNKLKPAVYALTKDSELDPDEEVTSVRFQLGPLDLGQTTDFEDRGGGLKLFKLERRFNDVEANTYQLNATGFTKLGVPIATKERQVLFWDLPTIYKFLKEKGIPIESLYVGITLPGRPGDRTIKFSPIFGVQFTVPFLDKLPVLKLLDRIWSHRRIANWDEFSPETKWSLAIAISASVRSTDTEWRIGGQGVSTWCSPVKVDPWFQPGVFENPFVGAEKGCISFTFKVEGKWVDGKKSPESWKLPELKFSPSFAVGYKLPILKYLVKAAPSPKLAFILRYMVELNLLLDVRLETVWIWREGVPEWLTGSGLQFQGTNVTIGIRPAVEVKLGFRPIFMLGAKLTAVPWTINFRVNVGTGLEWDRLRGCSGGCSLEFTYDALLGYFSGGIMSFTIIPEFTIPLGSAESTIPEETVLTAGVTNRSWVGAGYATFRGGEGGVLVERVWPGSEPGLAAVDHRRILVAYSHDDPSRPLGRSLDLRYTVWNGSAWSAPKVLETDERNDLSPVLAIGKEGEAGAVWQRVKGPLSSELSLDDAASKLELVFSRYAFASDSWTSPLQVTDDNMPDKHHTISGDGLGNYLLAWVRDEDGDYFTEENNTLWVRLFVNGQFRSPEKVGTVYLSRPPAVSLLPSGQAVIAWASDDDGNASTLDGRVQWTTGLPLLNAWTKPQGVSNETRHADEPTITQDALGQLSLIWRERVNGTTEDSRGLDRDAVLQANLVKVPLAVPPTAPSFAMGNPREIYRAPPEERISNPRLFHDCEGCPVLAWQSYGNFEDLRYKVLQNGRGVKGFGVPGAQWASQLALLKDAQGDPFLFATYLREDSAGLVHLEIARRAILEDVAVQALRVAPPNPAPGTTATVNVTLENLGDAATGAFNLTFKDDGEPFATVAFDSLAPGEQRSVEVDWDVLNEDMARVLLVVADEDMATRDADRSNNEVQRTLVLPDPKVEVFVTSGRPGSIRLLASVKNVGVRAMPSAPVIVEALEGGDAALGVPPTPRELIATTTLPSLPKNQREILDLVLPTSVLAAGTHLLRLRVEAAEDFDPADSALEETLRLAADLRVTLESEPIPDAPSFALRTTVTNQGSVASPASVVELRESDPAAGPPIAAMPLPPLNPGESALVTATWTPNRTGDLDVYAVADPSRAIAELDYGNNVGHRSLKAEPLPDLALDAGSVFYTPAGVEIRLWNRGLAPVSSAAAKRFRDATDIGMSAFADLQPGGFAVSLLGAERMNYSLLTPASKLRLIADPGDRVRELSGANNVLEGPMVAARSATHPNTFDWFPSTTASFALSALPTFNAVGYSFIVDQLPATVPDNVVDTTLSTLSVGPLPPGEHYLHVRAVNATGVATNTLHYRFRIQTADTLPPITKLTLLDENVLDDQRYVSERTRFVLDALDPSPEDGSSARTGVAATFYQVDDGPALAFAAPFTLAGLRGGVHTVRFWSVDLAGNVEAANLLSMFLEVPLPPNVEGAAEGLVEDLGTLYTDQRGRVVLGAEEPAVYRTFFPLGIDRIEFSIDGGPFQAYSAPIPAVQPGDNSGAKHQLAFRSISKAGLASETKSLAWVVDLDAPSAALPFVYLGPNGAIQRPAQNATIAHIVTFEGRAGDATSRVAKAQFSVDGNVLATFSAEPGQEVFNWTVDTRGWRFGNNAVRVSAADPLGHTASREVNVYALTTTFTVRKHLEDNLRQYAPPLGAPTPLQAAVDQAIEAARNATAGKADPALNTVQQAQANAQGAGSGYLVFDSSSLAGPSFTFEDISATGTRVVLGDEQLSAALAIPAVRFYGTSYNRVHVSSNGWLTFTGGQPAAPQAQSIPSPAPPNNLIAAYWADLDPSQGGSVHVKVVGSAPLRTAIVQFQDVPHKGDASKLASFQVRLQETTGIIEVHYLRAHSDGTFHAAGLENPDGTRAAVYKVGSFSLEQAAVRYVPHTGLVQR